MRATSDAAGMIQTSLQVPRDLAQNPKAVIWARLNEPGYKQTAICWERSNPLKSWIPTLTPEAGGTVSGRIEDGAGRGVPKADVRLIALDGDRRTPAGEEETESDGTFAFDYQAAGTFQVFALSHTNGIGNSAALQLGLVQRHPALSIAVGGGVELSGRVTDSKREPLWGLRVSAVPLAELEEPPAWSPFKEVQAGALFGNHAWVQRDGSFSIPALVPGPYEVRGDWYQRNSRSVLARRLKRSGVALGAGIASREDEALEFQRTDTRIELVVRDHEGQLIDLEARKDVVKKNSFGREPTLEIFEVDGNGQALFAMDSPYIHRSLNRELALYHAQSGKRYLLAWRDFEVSYAETLIEFRPGENCARAELQLADPKSLGTVTFEVRDSAGVLFEKPEIEVRSLLSGVMARTSLHASSHGFNEISGSSWTVRLSPGRYQVTAYPDRLQRTSWRTMRLVPYIASKQVVEVAPGDEKSLTFTLENAGYLFFESLTEGLSPDEDWQIHFARKHKKTLHNEVSECLDSHNLGRLRLIGKSGRVIEVDRLKYLALYESMFEDLGVGFDARVQQAIPVGEWLLVLENEAQVIYQTEIRIEANKATTVRW